MAKTYRINEAFWSLQGEGMRAGQASLFLRFTGCNLRCQMEPGPKSPGGFDCDTEFAGGRNLTAPEIGELMFAVLGRDLKWVATAQPYVVCTGGEPAQQLDADLVAYLHDLGWRVAIETNGSLPVDHLPLDWITVSPKVAEHAVRVEQASEIKYVRTFGQALPKPRCRATWQWLSPATRGLEMDQKALDWCTKLCLENPEWRLTTQAHKTWKMP